MSDLDSFAIRSDDDPEPTRQPPRPWWQAAVVVVLLLGIAAYFYFRAPAEEPAPPPAPAPVITDKVMDQIVKLNNYMSLGSICKLPNPRQIAKVRQKGGGNTHHHYILTHLLQSLVGFVHYALVSTLAPPRRTF